MRTLNILGADSCPCSNKKGAPLSMTKPTRAPVPSRGNNPEPRQCAVNNNRQCSPIKAHIEEYVHYDCRACFRVRFSYHFSDVGINQFHSEDYLLLKYDQQVFYESGPSQVNGATVYKHFKDGYVTQINFADNAHLYN